MSSVIQARGLTKRYDSFVAVDAVDFKIVQGECYGFLGPNGAGKTTTMKMIYCFSPVSEGRLEVLGHDVTEDPRRIKALLGVAPQEDNLDPDFTVRQNLTVYARYFGIDKGVAAKRADELLTFMHLEQKAGVKVEALSGGMKRRLIIARALMNDPRVLILDEPTTGLDPQARHVIWEKIRDLKRKGVTVLLTTHYMDEAEQLCDRLVIMEGGKIVVEGPPRRLIEEIIGTEVLEIHCSSDRLEGLIRDRALLYERTLDRVIIYTDRPAELMEEVARRFEVSQKLIRHATLEDVFLRLTGRGLRE